MKLSTICWTSTNALTADFPDVYNCVVNEALEWQLIRYSEVLHRSSGVGKV